MASHTRDENVYLAKLSEQAERYDEMVEAMKKVAAEGIELSVEERNLLSVAYKNVIGARRASWRILSAIEAKEKSKENMAHAGAIVQYRLKVESELKDVCRDVLEQIDSALLPMASSAEAKVFFMKMKGDYCRYLAEFQVGEDRKSAGNDSLVAYKEAMQVAESGLSTTHPVRLGLALNFSVFYYEVLNEHKQACELAKSAFDDAIQVQRPRYNASSPR